MQAELPDKNTAFIVYRREAISSFKSGKYDSCVGALKSIMGLLPKDYRPIVSTEEYENQTKLGLFVNCPECKSQTMFDSVKTYQKFLTFDMSVLTGQQKQDVWDCPICNKTNIIANTNFVKKILEEPYFPKVIPRPPGRKDGMLGRTQFRNKFSDWFWDKALPIIEAQCGRYREEYVPEDQLNDFEQDNDIPDGGEKED